MTKTTLGRGLAALIPTKIDKTIVGKEEILGPSDRILEVEVNKIQTNPHQPRKEFDDFSLEDLTQSIKQHGILQPLIVTQTPMGYQLISGERRLRASRKLGLAKVPVVIRSASEQEKLELALVENVQRRDLNPLERAWGYKRLHEEFNLTQEEVGKKVGQSRAAVTNSLRLLTLPEEIQKALVEGRITEGHAKVLLGFQDRQTMARHFNDVLRGNLSVRVLEERARIHRRKQGAAPQPTDAPTQAREERLREALGTKVYIRKKGQKGEIVVEYYTEEELNDLIGKLTK